MKIMIDLFLVWQNYYFYDHIFHISLVEFDGILPWKWTDVLKWFILRHLQYTQMLKIVHILRLKCIIHNSFYQTSWIMLQKVQSLIILFTFKQQIFLRCSKLINQFKLKRYASLYFVLCIDSTENELGNGLRFTQY